MELNVYVPKVGTQTWFVIDRKSGIVGTPGKRCEPGEVLVDFEGNRFGAGNIITWADRTYHAADRHTYADGRGYPTVARMSVPADDLTLVGTIDYGWPGTIDLTPEALDPTSPEHMELLDWLAVDVIDPNELRTS